MPEVNDVLNHWNEWEDAISQRPTVVRALTSGLTNSSYLVTADNKSWVLRINAANADILGIDRHREARILAAASKAGIAPQVAYCSPEQGILLSEFIDGQQLAPDQSCTGRYVAQFDALVRRIQRLEIDLPPDDCYAHAERYLAALVAQGVAPSADLIRERDGLMNDRARFSGSVDTICLCHRDLNPNNLLVRGDDLYVLDWEYATRCWYLFDYACLATEWHLPINCVCEQLGIDTRTLEHATDLYRYTCKIWALLQTITRSDNSLESGHFVTRERTSSQVQPS